MCSQVVSNGVSRMLHNDYVNGGGVIACIIPYHIESAIKYAPLPGDTTYHHPLSAQYSGSGCAAYSNMLRCWHRMYAHTYILTE